MCSGLNPFNPLLEGLPQGALVDGLEAEHVCAHRTANGSLSFAAGDPISGWWLERRGSGKGAHAQQAPSTLGSSAVLVG